jgi:hypothetical protein
MALKKTAGGTAGTAKKSAATGGAAKKAAPKKASGAGSSATKKAAPKKAAAPKLSPTQSDLLKKVGGFGEAGYRADKKPENKSLESLLKHKLVKRGKKDQQSGNYNYSISKAGQKHLSTAEGSGSSASKGS